MTAISPPLRLFLEQRLSSFDQLEVVLLLRREPGRAWTAPEVSKALGTAPEPAAMRLFLLASAGLITFEPSGVPKYRYTPGDSETESLLDELTSVYERDRSAISTIVGAPPPDPLRSFADAFKWKK
jgi:hypothetical protein